MIPTIIFIALCLICIALVAGGTREEHPAPQETKVINYPKPKLYSFHIQNKEGDTLLQERYINVPSGCNPQEYADRWAARNIIVGWTEE